MASRMVPTATHNLPDVRARNSAGCSSTTSVQGRPLVVGVTMGKIDTAQLVVVPTVAMSWVSPTLSTAVSDAKFSAALPVAGARTDSDS